MFKSCLALSFLLGFLCTAQALPDARTQPLKGTVSLTFDDGPSATYTPQILAILKKNNIKATFFVMGAIARAHPELIKLILADGHAVALHTMTHPNLDKISQKQLHYEVADAQNIVNKVVGKGPLCLRPPYGVANHNVKEYIRSQKMIPVAMGFNSFDYNRPGTEKIASWVIKNAHSGVVFLLHDGYKSREQTVAALPIIIEGIRKKGLGFSAICYP
jgi:peptidoglycan/xylan/chitin deacetylase (PgdA/CDA1 family)